MPESRAKICLVMLRKNHKTTDSSRQACFVIAHSSGDLMNKILKCLKYVYKMTEVSVLIKVYSFKLDDGS